MNKKIVKISFVAAATAAVSATAITPAIAASAHSSASASATSTTASASSTASSTDNKREVPDTLAGKVVDVTFDTGAASTLTFAQDGKSLSYRRLEDGEVRTVDVTVVKNGEGIFLVTWYEPDTKITVTHLQNYNTGVLSATWTHPDAEGDFVVDGHEGTVTLAK